MDTLTATIQKEEEVLPTSESEEERIKWETIAYNKAPYWNTD